MNLYSFVEMAEQYAPYNFSLLFKVFPNWLIVIFVLVSYAFLIGSGLLLAFGVAGGWLWIEANSPTASTFLSILWATVWIALAVMLVLGYLGNKKLNSVAEAEAEAEATKD